MPVEAGRQLLFTDDRGYAGRMALAVICHRIVFQLNFTVLFCDFQRQNFKFQRLGSGVVAAAVDAHRCGTLADVAEIRDSIIGLRIENPLAVRRTDCHFRLDRAAGIGERAGFFERCDEISIVRNVHFFNRENRIERALECADAADRCIGFARIGIVLITDLVIDALAQRAVIVCDNDGRCLFLAGIRRGAGYIKFRIGK